MTKQHTSEEFEERYRHLDTSKANWVGEGKEYQIKDSSKEFEELSSQPDSIEQQVREILENIYHEAVTQSGQQFIMPQEPHEKATAKLLKLIQQARVEELDAVQNWNLKQAVDYGELGNVVKALDLENYLYARQSELNQKEGLE